MIKDWSKLCMMRRTVLYNLRSKTGGLHEAPNSLECHVMSVVVCGVHRTRVNMFATTRGEGVCVCVFWCARVRVFCGVRACVRVCAWRARACVCV